MGTMWSPSNAAGLAPSDGSETATSLELIELGVLSDGGVKGNIHGATVPGSCEREHLYGS
jgi:hypothetical protein